MEWRHLVELHEHFLQRTEIKIKSVSFFFSKANAKTNHKTYFLADPTLRTGHPAHLGIPRGCRPQTSRPNLATLW
jgi:hypothetical protein